MNWLRGIRYAPASLLLGILIFSYVTPAHANTFSQNRALWESGADIKALQQYLNTHGFIVAATGVGSPGKETALFGPRTYQALVKFQKANSLSTTGFFGPQTRAVIEGSGANSSSSANIAPKLNSLVPPTVAATSSSIIPAPSAPGNYSPGFGGGVSSVAISTIAADNTAPAISAIASSTAPTTATITWITDEAATSQIEYGATSAYGATTTLDAVLVTSHSVTISGLTGSTIYHFRVRSSDVSGNLATSTDQTFTTSTTPDNTPPTVSVTAPTNGSTVFGAAVTLSASASDNVAVAGVQFKVNGVSVGSEDTSSPYSIAWDSTATSSGTKTIVAVARDGAGNVSTSTAITVTVDNTAPVISAVATSSVTTTSATITWTTDEAATSQVSYGITSSYGSQTTLDSTLVTSHSVNITGLTPSGAYHFQVVSTDAANNTASSSDYRLDAAATPPALVEDFENIGGFTYGTSAGSGSIAATTTHLTGSNALAVTNGNAGVATLYADKTYSSPIQFGSDDVLSFAYYTSSNVGVNAVTLELTGTGGTVGIKSSNVTPPGMGGIWQRVTLNRSEFTNASALTGNITKVRYRVNFNASAVANDFVAIDGFYMSAKGRAQIIVGFDDGYSNQFTFAKPLMDAANIPGTLYLQTSGVGTGSGTTARSTLAQMQAAFASGWDIANHTSTHPSMAPYTPTQVQAEWDAAASYISSNGMSRAERYAALPGGSVSANVITGSANAGMKIIRGSFGNPSDLNNKLPLPQPLLVPGISFNTTSTAIPLAAVDSAILHGTTVIIWSHDISASPSIGTTESAWTTVINYIIAKKDAGLLDTVTISQLGAQLGL